MVFFFLHLGQILMALINLLLNPKVHANIYKNYFS